MLKIFITKTDGKSFIGTFENEKDFFNAFLKENKDVEIFTEKEFLESLIKERRDCVNSFKNCNKQWIKNDIVASLRDINREIYYLKEIYEGGDCLYFNDEFCKTHYLGEDYTDALNFLKNDKELKFLFGIKRIIIKNNNALKGIQRKRSR